MTHRDLQALTREQHDGHARTAEGEEPEATPVRDGGSIPSSRLQPAVLEYLLAYTLVIAAVLPGVTMIYLAGKAIFG